MPCFHSFTVYLQGVDASSLPCVLPLERCATAACEQACKQERGTCPALMMAAACGGTRRQLRRPAPRCRHAHAAIIARWLWQQRAHGCHHVAGKLKHRYGRNRFQKHVEGKREGSEGEASGCGSEGELRCMMKERALRKLRYDFILTRKSMR